MLKYLCLIYNSLIGGFDFKQFNRSDITKYDPDHWMWSEKKLYSIQTYFFNFKKESFAKLKGPLSTFVANQKKELQPIASEETIAVSKILIDLKS